MAAAGTSTHTNGTAADSRVDWVDYAKGICIVMVVMMHSTLGVELAAGREGFMPPVVEFARPFRLPASFLISGLFFGPVFVLDCPPILDRRSVHSPSFSVPWV